MADINDRLERLSRRDELTRRVLQHRAVPPEVAGVGGDFLDVVEAVVNVVRRHPGMSIMLAPGDGRPGSAVVRVTEQHGDAEVALVTTPAEGGRPVGPDRRDDSPSEPAAPRARPAAPAPTRVPAGSVPAGSGQAGPGPAGSGQAGSGGPDESEGPDGSGRPEQPSTPAWRPPGPWRPRPTGPKYGGGQPEGWRWGG
jgi:hypothetical protein